MALSEASLSGSIHCFKKRINPESAGQGLSNLIFKHVVSSLL